MKIHFIFSDSIDEILKKQFLKEIGFLQIKTWLNQAEKMLQKQKNLNSDLLCQLKKNLNIVFVSKKEISRLNQQFRKKNKFSDILSFAPTEDAMLGELILCWPVIYEKTQAGAGSLSEQLCWLVLHGLLHLLGFEHEQGGRQAKKMYQLQEQLFEKILQK